MNHSTVDNPIVHSLHLKYRKDKRVIRAVKDHPILFAKSKIIDDNDWRPIRIRYFGVFMWKDKREYVGHKK